MGKEYGFVKPGEYRYSEVCEIRGEQQFQGGAQRKAQADQWAREYEVEKPRRGVFRFGNKRDIPLAKNDGRKGNKRVSKTQNDFEYLINAFLCETSRDFYYRRKDRVEIITTGNQLCKYFGLYDNSFYSAKNDKNVDLKTFEAVIEKIQEKKRSLIIDKVKATESISMERRLASYISYYDKTEKKQHYAFKNVGDLELFYGWFEPLYIKANGLRSDGEVVRKGLWLDKAEWLCDALRRNGLDDGELRDQDGVMPCLVFDMRNYGKPSVDAFPDKKKHKEAFNSYVVDSLKSYFEKNHEKKGLDLDSVNCVIDNYVALQDKNRANQIGAVA